MKSIIEEIFYGNRGNFEKIDYGEEYTKITSKYSDLCDALCNELTEKQKAQFNEITSVDAASEAEAVRVHFIEGFKIGFLIAIECLSDF